MDDRTARLLDALDPVAVQLLLELLAGPRTEAELLVRESDLGQPTGNRRLHHLKESGLIEQEAGKARAPGRLWSIRHPAEIERVVTALLDLAGAIDERERRERERISRKVKRARAKRIGIRAVESRPRRHDPG